MKINRAENFIRSAKAPAISAGVMMAKVIWNAEKTYSGMVGASELVLLMPMPLRKTWAKEPMNLPGLAGSSLVKAIE